LNASQIASTIKRRPLYAILKKITCTAYWKLSTKSFREVFNEFLVMKQVKAFTNKETTRSKNLKDWSTGCSTAIPQIHSSGWQLAFLVAFALPLLLLNVTLRLLFVMVLALKWITHRKRLPEINRSISTEPSWAELSPGVAHSPIGTCVFGSDPRLELQLEWQPTGLVCGTYKHINMY